MKTLNMDKYMAASTTHKILTVDFSPVIWSIEVHTNENVLLFCNEQIQLYNV